MDITQDIDQVEAGISSLQTHNGGDGPEDYSRALSESLLIGWRPGAKRVIVLFGDAPAHDTSFYSTNYGVDPGSDEQAGTADDLLFVDIIAALANAPVEIIPIDSGADRDALTGFEYMAGQTGGEVFTIATASQAPEAVTRGLEGAASTINSLMLELSSDAPPWMSFEPGEFSSVGGGEDRTFTLRFSVPASASSGVYQFNILILADGANLGAVPVTINVAGGSSPGSSTGGSTGLQDLITDKQKLVEQLSKNKFDLEILENVIQIELPNTYGPVEQQVSAYITPLPRDSAQPGLVAGLGRLRAQEQGMLDLWSASKRSSNVIGNNIGHVLLVCWKMVSFLKFFTRPDIVNKAMGGWATKLLNEIKAKIIDIVATLIKFFIGMLPDKNETLRDALKNFINIGNAAAQRAVASGKGSRP